MNAKLLRCERVHVYPFFSQQFELFQFHDFISLSVLVEYESKYQGEVFFIEFSNTQNKLLISVPLRASATSSQRSVLVERIALKPFKGSIKISIQTINELVFKLKLYVI